MGGKKPYVVKGLRGAFILLGDLQTGLAILDFLGEMEHRLTEEFWFLWKFSSEKPVHNILDFKVLHKSSTYLIVFDKPLHSV